MKSMALGSKGTLYLFNSRFIKIVRRCLLRRNWVRLVIGSSSMEHKGVMFVQKRTKSFGLFSEAADQITKRFHVFLGAARPTVTLPHPDI